MRCKLHAARTVALTILKFVYACAVCEVETFSNLCLHDANYPHLTG
jgi:hypothetical protein